MRHVDEVLATIRSTREMSFPMWGNVESLTKPNGTAAEVVTAVDREIEQYLAREFRKLDPGIAFVGEEFGGDRSTPGHWLVDPIDATAHFVRGTPFCTTMAALIEDGRVTFAAIYDFVRDVMYHAVLGGGAYENGRPIRVSDRGLADAYLFYESDLDKGGNRETYLAIRRRVQLLNTISAGYEFALVASGKMEGRICLDPFGKDYDFAPGSLLVAEAGGIVANIGYDSFAYRNLNFIAANERVYRALTSGPDNPFG